MRLGLCPETLENYFAQYGFDIEEINNIIILIGNAGYPCFLGFAL
jgi:hypothetical protein